MEEKDEPIRTNPYHDLKNGLKNILRDYVFLGSKNIFFTDNDDIYGQYLLGNESVQPSVLLLQLSPNFLLMELSDEEAPR